MDIVCMSQEVLACRHGSGRLLLGERGEEGRWWVKCIRDSAPKGKRTVTCDWAETMALRAAC